MEWRIRHEQSPLLFNRVVNLNFQSRPFLQRPPCFRNIRRGLCWCQHIQLSVHRDKSTGFVGWDFPPQARFFQPSVWSKIVSATRIDPSKSNSRYKTTRMINAGLKNIFILSEHNGRREMCYVSNADRLKLDFINIKMDERVQLPGLEIWTYNHQILLTKHESM